MRMPTPDVPSNPTYPNEWFMVVCGIILLAIWFSGPLLRLVDRITKQ